MSVAIFAVLVLASLLFILWIAQEKIVFQPPRNFSDADSGFARVLEYHAADGQRLVGYLLENPNATGLLICFHGNADLAAWQEGWAREASRRTDHAIFLAEYRGYFGLTGKPTYATTSLDADAAYRAAIDASGVPPALVSFFGHSLGSAVASELATRVPARRLLLQSPFTTARAMGRIVIGRPLAFLWDSLSRVHFDTVKIAASIATPVSVAHGARDRIVPLKMGEAVYAAARVRGELLVIPEAGHNDIPAAGGDLYWKWIAESLG